ncbi:ubiquitin-conjugating enzyme E2 J1 isoform X3 [Corythoichthys intestinalis]|uniref:ubiquitin-conjugating enzyme E2 J1 isoform X3 n=1 Tax=Corythoichthys intestinalis TaxID=161448 RepID=UPI0025A6160B|nr:ubiquitin-conjugating enzyme E2 J1 isoform X3 [Corythoichthys intestinalis]
MESKYNLKSPAVKRLMKEAAELRDPTEHYHAQPLEDNLFEWHFSVRGPPDSDFDGGIYHGRILLPPEYPMKPPSIILLTPNGRFEVGKKICLSISGHHPETWQPSWSIRTALIAIIGFMPTKGEGAIGSLDYTPEERRVLAKKSQDFCCETCNCSLSSTLLPLNPNSDISLEDQMANELAHQINFKTETSTATGADRERSSNDDRPHSPTRRRAILHQRDNNQAPNRPRLIAEVHQPQNDGHTGSAVLIVVLTLALAALIFRRIFLAHDYKFEYEL